MLSLTRCPFSLLDLPMRFTNDCRIGVGGIAGTLTGRMRWIATAVDSGIVVAKPFSSLVLAS